MEARAKRLPKLRKIDNRVPRLRDRSTARETPRLDPVDRALLRVIDGAASVHAIALAAERQDDEIACLLDRLERLGMITLVEASKQPSSPPSPLPTRLKSGIRPVMQTSPADAHTHAGELTMDLSDDGSDAALRDEPGPSSPIEYVTAVTDVRRDDTADDADDPGARLTLPGIGPHAAAQ